MVFYILISEGFFRCRYEKNNEKNYFWSGRKWLHLCHSLFSVILKRYKDRHRAVIPPWYCNVDFNVPWLILTKSYVFPKRILQSYSTVRFLRDMHTFFRYYEYRPSNQYRKKKSFAYINIQNIKMGFTRNTGFPIVSGGNAFFFFTLLFFCALFYTTCSCCVANIHI